jgi:hypothetical protein
MRKDKEPEEPKPIGTPGFATSTWIFEQVAQNVYLVFDRVTQKYHVFPYSRAGMRVEDRDYVPLPRLPWPSAKLPDNFDDPETLAQTKKEFIKRINEGPPQNLLPDYESAESLFNEIREFFMEHLDVRNELLYDVYACFVLMSWRLEDFKVVPYQMFLGPPASGKTRGMECFKYIGYRAIMSSSMSAATIFRTLEAWHCLLLLDETEIYGRESMVEVLALLNSGYRKGQYAIRIEKLEGELPQIAMFDTFGPKVLAGTEELAATLQSRAILTTMSKNVRHVRLFVDEEKAQELRNKLLLYRFRNLGSKSEFDIAVLNGYFRNARVIELFVSLLEVAPTQEIRDRLIQCMKSITQTRLDEEQASIEARVFDAVLKSWNLVENGKVSTQGITDTFNIGLVEKEQSSSRFIGRKVAALGFEKCRLSGGPSGFFWNEQLIERLKARYYPDSDAVEEKIESKIVQELKKHGFVTRIDGKKTKKKSMEQKQRYGHDWHKFPNSDAVPKTTSQTSQTSLTSLSMEKTEESRGAASEGSEVIPTDPPVPEASRKSMNSEVSEQSEVSEVSLGALVNKIEKLERLEGKFEDKCFLCSYSGRMDYQATFHNQTWTLLCGICGLKVEERLKRA